MSEGFGCFGLHGGKVTPGTQAVILSCLQVKTHLQAQAASEIAVGHQYKHQVRVPQTTGAPDHLPPFFPNFLPIAGSSI